MKRYRHIIILLSIMCFLVGCTLLHKEGDSPYYSGNRYDLYRLALNSFPGPREGRGAIIDETSIEKDDYGRELYIIQFHHAGWFYYDTIVNDSNVNAAYVISQGHDDQRVYYYEDLCFKLFDDSENIQRSLLEEMKMGNDWNKPINKDKCSSRLYTDDFAGMQNLTFNYDAWKSISSLFGKESQICAITEDASGKELYGVCVEKDGIKASYLVIYHPGKEIDIEKDTLKLSSFDFGTELHEFKTQHDWDFINCPRG